MRRWERCDEASRDLGVHGEVFELVFCYSASLHLFLQAYTKKFNLYSVLYFRSAETEEEDEKKTVLRFVP